MYVFFQCVAEAVVEKGLRGLAGMVPGGSYAYEVGQAVVEKYRKRKKDAEQRAEIQKLAQEAFEEARRAGAEAARQAAPAATAEDRTVLELFLAGIPAAARQSLKRPDDPTGMTVPVIFSLNSPEDVLRLLPPRPPRFRPGDPLSGKPGWVLSELLGAGGFGEVWLARHPHAASLCGAVKFCHGPHARDLRHEGTLIDRVTQAGRHAGVVPLLDLNLDGENPWLMYEYVRGGDLADWIRKIQGLPAEERVGHATTALRQLATTVGYFHRLTPPIVHRDLKPSNILLDRATRRLRITDFGIGGAVSRAALDAEARGSQTRAGRLLSYLRGSHTPLYASPQQRAGADPDPRDDVHALGVIGYQMLTGHLDLGAGPDFADDLREAGAGAGLIALLGRCVAQKADRRPQDAAELAEQLAAFAPTGRPEARPPAPATESRAAPARDPVPPEEMGSGEADPVRTANLAAYLIPTWLMESIPESIARENGCVPLSMNNGVLKVAVADPHNTDVLEKLTFILNKKVVPLAADAEHIMQAIDRSYRPGIDYSYEAMDTSGDEVRGAVRATDEEDAQQQIKRMGLFVTRLARPPVYVFFYEALDTSGEEASGVVEATGEEDACEQIKRMGLFITKITRSQEAKSEGSGVSWWGRLWGKRSRR